MPRNASHALNGAAMAPSVKLPSQTFSDELLPSDERAAQEIVVTAEVLRGAVHDEVDAQNDRLLVHWRRKGVVAEGHDSQALGQRTDLRQIG